MDVITYPYTSIYSPIFEDFLLFFIGTPLPVYIQYPGVLCMRCPTGKES